MPIGLIIAIGFMAGEYIYNWLNRPPPPTPPNEVVIPLTTDGTPVPLLYGRCRVQSPILAYIGTPLTQLLSDGVTFEVYIDVFMVLGIPFDSNGINKLFNFYAGDALATTFADSNGTHIQDYIGSGNYESGGNSTATHTGAEVGVGVDVGGAVEWLNGNPSQQLVDPTSGVPSTVAGLYMTTPSGTLLGTPFTINGNQVWNHGTGIVAPSQIPGYRNFLSVMHWGQGAGDARGTGDAVHWCIGLQNSMAAYSYEVGAYPGSSALGLVGVDCNPIDVIYDLLTGGFGKLGYDPSIIDSSSFTVAGLTLKAENHGFSRCFDQRTDAQTMLTEICQQIDAVLFQDPSTGTIKIKLIRADYDTASLPIINPDNCEELQNFAAGGWTDVVNRVVLTFTDRVSDYKPGTAIARSQANAVGQDGQVNEVQLSFPGITTQELADTVADRILVAASRPLMKLSAIVNRSFLRVLPGDAVKLNWPEANIANIVFRVAGGTRGTLESGAIKLDLVQDYFYTHRNLPPISIIESFGGAHAFGGELP